MAKSTDINKQDVLLKKHGYMWQTETRYGWQYDECGTKVFVLYAPDGRIVSLDQALDEIRLGVDVVKAKIEAQAKVDAEMKAKEEAEFEAKIQAAISAKSEFDAAKAEYLEGMQANSNPNWNDVRFGEIVFDNPHATIMVAYNKGVQCKAVIFKQATDDIYTLFEVSSGEVNNEGNYSTTLDDFFC